MIIMFLMGVLAALLILRFRTRLRHPLIAAGAIIFLVLSSPSLAFAAVPPGGDVPVGPDTDVDSLFKLTPFWVQIIGGSLLPFAIAFVTNQNIAPWFKKTLLALGAALVGLLATATTDGAGDSVFTQSALESAVFAFLAAAGVYTFFVRNSKTEAKLQAAGPDIGPRQT